MTLASGHSGVTIGSGVDLANGTITQAVFSQLFNNYSTDIPSYSADPNLQLLYDVTRPNSKQPGPKLQTAAQDLGPPDGATRTIGTTKFTVQSVSSSITQSQANVLSNKAEQDHFIETANAWQKYSGSPFVDIPNSVAEQVQTVLIDQDFNSGSINAVKASILKAVNSITQAQPYGTASAWQAVDNAIANSPVATTNPSRATAEIGLIDQLKSLALLGQYSAASFVTASAGATSRAALSQALQVGSLRRWRCRRVG